MQSGVNSGSVTRRDDAVVFMRHFKEEQRSERRRGRARLCANF